MKMYFVGFDVFILCGIDIYECIYIFKIDFGNIIEIVLFFFGGKFFL